MSTQPCAWGVKQFDAYDDSDDYSDDSGKNNNKTITVMLFINSNYRPLIRCQALLQVTYIYITSFPDMAGAIIISISQKRKLNVQDGEVTGQLVSTRAGVQTQVVPPESMAYQTPFKSRTFTEMGPGELWPQRYSLSLLPFALVWLSSSFQSF